MKKIKFIFVFFLLIFCLITSAQKDWAPIGAKWYYSTPYYSFPYYTRYGSCIFMESMKDTIINELESKALEIRGCATHELVARLFIRQSGDSVFYFNDNYNDFFLLYNFSAKAGDTITVHDNRFKPIPAYLYEDSIDYFKYRIISIDSIETSGNWLKRQKIDVSGGGDWGWFESSYIIEKLGSIIYFFGRSGYITPEEEYGNLRCYSDNSINYNSPTWNRECNYTNIRNDLIKSLYTYPNPVNDYIILESEIQNITCVMIYDELGRSISYYNIVGNRILLNLETISPGIYIMGISLRDEIIFKKFIKLK